MDKKKILVFIDWYLPGYKAGGPIRSVSNIIATLCNDIDFFVFTRNSDLGDDKPYPGIVSDKWINHPGKYHVFYASSGFLTLKNIYKILFEREYHFIYINGIFSFHFNILPLLISRFFLLKSRTMVSPRGMLGSGALSLKPLKKKGFLTLAKIFGIFKRVIFHASTEMEEKEIENIFGPEAKIKKALNISLSPPEFTFNKEKINGDVRFFFLSRVSPKKNLIFALKILSEINSGNVMLDIFGPIEDENYWNECESLIKSMRNGVQVNYKGILLPEKNFEILSSYHFMFFPTLNENYGHVIFEALSVGCPVIISDQTPWNKMEEKKIGWEIPLNQKEKYMEVVQKCIEMNSVEYREWSQSAAEYSRMVARNSNTLGQNRKLFLD